MKGLSRTRFAVGFAPKRAGWWLLVVACLCGLASIGLALAPAIATFPAAALTAAVLTVPLVVAWWWLLRMPQLWGRVARSGALAAAAWGALAAAGIYALPANSALIAVMGQRLGIDVAQSWGAAIIAPLTEETGKAMAIAVVLLASGQRLRTPMDAALIAAFSAVGFTATEDFLYALNVGYLNLGENEVVSTTVVYFARAILFGAVSHVVFSGFVGAGVGYLAVGRHRARVAVGVALILAGALLHGVWNTDMAGWARLVYPLAVPLAVWLLLRALRREERRWFVGVLSAPGALGRIPTAYIDAVKATWWKRRSYRASVARTYGPPAVVAQRELEAALTDLADAVDVGDATSAADVRSRLERDLAVAQ